MKPLIVLLISFALSLFGTKFLGQNIDYALSGKIAMSVMLLFTAFGHFAFKKGMAMMIPEPIPYKSMIVFLSGIFEILISMGLLISDYSELTAWIIIIFFILVLPANIYATIHKVDYQKGTYDGKGIAYLWLRIPMQILYIAWVYVFVIMM